MIAKREVLFNPTNERRMLHIYFPDDYEQSKERYPVMYFFDGHNLFFDEDATYGKSWGLKEFLDTWKKKMIVVGIECSHRGNYRLTEYCPYHTYAGFLGEIEGIGKETMDWIVMVLKPMIDREYRTYSFREATGIAGSSMGGLMSLYAAIKYNAYFSKAACLSSAIGFCMEDLEKDLRESKLEEDTRVYLSWGEKEAGDCKEGGNKAYDTGTAICNRKIAGDLEKRGLLTRIYFQEDGGHCEADWEKQLSRFMDYLWLDC